MSNMKENNTKKNYIVMNKTKIKFYHLYGNAIGEDGKNHIVTVVGRLEQGTEKKVCRDTVPVEIRPGSVVPGELNYKRKQFKRKLTLGVSICHPMDEFDLEKGIEIAKSRIRKGEDAGVLETSSVTMLTDDAIMAELLIKLQYIVDNINEFLPEE